MLSKFLLNVELVNQVQAEPAKAKLKLDLEEVGVTKIGEESIDRNHPGIHQQMPSRI